MTKRVTDVAARPGRGSQAGVARDREAMTSDGAITAALVLAGVRAMTSTERRELLTLLGLSTDITEPTTGLIPLAYTSATLAASLGITDRAVRGAIARGELVATKRGRRWLIDARSADRYATTPLSQTPAQIIRKRPGGGRGPMADALAAMPQTRV